MSDRALAIWAIVVGVVGILAVAIGEAFFSQSRETYWRVITLVGVLSCLVAALAVVLLISKKIALLAFLKIDFQSPDEKLRRFLSDREQEFFKQFDRISEFLIKLRQVRFVNNFGDYCDACREMLDKSGERDTILTVQTPVSLRPDAISGEERAKYNRYIKATTDKIISTDITYRRLVVLKDSDTDPEMKIKEFVTTLIETAIGTEKITSRDADLSNIFIGFIHFNSAPDLLYNNLDIHITTDRDFSVAFLSKTLIKRQEFGGSIHLHDMQGIVSRRLILDIEDVWKEIMQADSCIGLGEPYASGPKNDAAKNLTAKVDQIVARLKKSAVPAVS